MSDLAHAFGNLSVEEPQDAEHHVNDPQKEVPFRPKDDLVASLSDTPRFLFRVYSGKSAGENDGDWMKSDEAVTSGVVKDVFARRDPTTVAIALNEHLRWLSNKTEDDPFISWTTSLPFAIQYAIYKHKKERLELREIYLCVVDTLEFETGVFMRDLDLIDAFLGESPVGHGVIDNDGKLYPWRERGLSQFRRLRGRHHTQYSGVYYYGEFLAQGQINLEHRSCTISCDKVISQNLFILCPELENELNSHDKTWANAVNKYRRVFYQEGEEPGMTNDSDMNAASLIMQEFDSHFQLPVMANLLALRPRMSRDPYLLRRIPQLFEGSMRHDITFKETVVVADGDIPEVLQFKRILEDIKDSYREEIMETLGRIGDIGDIVRRFLDTANTTGAKPSATVRRLQNLEQTHLRALEEDLVGIIRGIL